MLPERHFPAEEDIHSDENTRRLEEVVRVFEDRLDTVRRGEVNSDILFEGDFDLSRRRNNGFHIDIGSGATIDPATLNTRFVRQMGRRGRIASSDFESLESSIKGNTNSAEYLRGRALSAAYPVERISYKLKTEKGFDLEVYRDRFFQNTKKEKPLLERWHTKLTILDRLPEGSFGKQLALPIPALS